MSDNSILDQIISTKQVDNLQKFKPSQTLEKLLSTLSNREKDIIKRRFGLNGGSCETLEKIGQSHQITRERVRQLNLSGINKIKKSVFFTEEVEVLKKIINHYLEDHGGIAEENTLLDALIELIADQDNMNQQDSLVIRSNLLFIIDQLLKDSYDRINESLKYNQSRKLKYFQLSLLDKINNSLITVLQAAGLPMFSQELTQKLRADLKNKGEDMDRLSDQVLISYFKVDRRVRQNIFDQWGLKEWNTISPKRMNDKIYLVLKKIGEPLHYRDIAQKINEFHFDKKIAHAETIHNELIMDSRYVLVGRGIYALKEWGYQKGTVADVIVDLLKESDKPLSRQDIIERVLKQRLVKKATIQLALMDKKKFTKLTTGEFMFNKGGNLT